MTATKTIQSSARVAGKNGFSLISDEMFRELYATLLKCGMLDERLRTNCCSYEQWAGREAVSAGVVTCLRQGDSVTLTSRGILAGYLLSGPFPSLRNIVKTPVAQLAAAAADARRHRLESLGNISVVFAERGKSQETHDAFSEAARERLPIFYVLEGDAALAKAGADVPVIRIDSCDAVAVYRVAHESIARARDGGGPTIMECAAWVADGELQDPLRKLERYLAGKKLFRQDWKLRLEKEYNAILNDAVMSLQL